MRAITAIFAIAWILISFNLQAKDKEPNTGLDNLYREAQREFHRKNFKAALPKLEKYISESKNKRYKKERLFWVIDQIGRIHLRVNRDPDAAIKFFEALITNDNRLSDAEEDDIGAWVIAAKNWKKSGKMPSEVNSEEDLFKLGKKYYLLGKKKQKYPADDAGNAHFIIAKTYLIPMIVNFDKSKNIGDALYMMGDIQRNLRTDPEYWNDNFYLKETIRRFPHTKLAMKAWKSLDEDMRLGYTGSGGVNIPDSLTELLGKYKELAMPKSEKK